MYLLIHSLIYTHGGACGRRHEGVLGQVAGGAQEDGCGEQLPAPRGAGPLSETGRILLEGALQEIASRTVPAVCSRRLERLSVDFVLTILFISMLFVLLVCCGIWAKEPPNEVSEDAGQAGRPGRLQELVTHAVRIRASRKPGSTFVFTLLRPGTKKHHLQVRLGWGRAQVSRFLLRELIALWRESGWVGRWAGGWAWCVRPVSAP